jgi:hypothetical protein
MAKKRSKGFKKRSTAAKKGWETRRKNQENKYIPIFGSKEEDTNMLMLLGIRTGYTERQLQSLYNSLFRSPFKSKEHQMARLILAEEDTLESDIQDLADFYDIDVEDLWSEIFKNY